MNGKILADKMFTNLESLYKEYPKNKRIYRIFGIYSYQWLESFEIAAQLGR